jgi:hypothetical protein
MSDDNVHTCGACGYDGGFKHLKNIEEVKDSFRSKERDMQYKLHETEKKALDTQDTRIHRIWTWGLAAVIIALILSVAGYNTITGYADRVKPVADVINHKTEQIVQPEAPLSVAYKELAAMYKHCIDNAQHNAEFLKGCNDTFKSAQNNFESMLTKEGK